jgi:hypothetical protein
MFKLKSFAGIIGCLVLAGCVSLNEPSQTGETKSTVGAKVVSNRFAPTKLDIANFDTGMKPNLLGGDFGAWDKDVKDETQYCEAEFQSEATGYSLKLIYDVDSPNPAYNGFWMKLEEADFSPYESISLSIKGDADKGATDKVAIELKNISGQSGKVFVPVTGEWQEKTIPLSSFAGIMDFSMMNEFVVVFDDTSSNPKTGAVYIDNIYVK